MSFEKKPRQVVNYEPPINRNIISTGNTNLISIIDENSTTLQTVGSGTPIYYYTNNSTAYIRSISGDSNVNIYTATTVNFNLEQSGDTIVVGLQPNIYVTSISATTFYSGSTNLNQFLTGGTSGISSLSSTGNGQTLIYNSNGVLKSLSGGNLTQVRADSTTLYVDHTLFKPGTGSKSFVLSGTSSTATNTYGISLGTNNTNSGQYSTILNGWGNAITANHSIVHGRGNTIASNYSVIGGGKTNLITSTATTQTIAGGYQNVIKGTGSHNAILGGATNIITGTSFNTIGGGQNNLIEGAIEHSFIGGGNLNSIKRSSLDSAIVGGLANNILSAQYSFVGGGRNNYISGATTITQSFIGGGFSNRIYDSRSTIGGGYNNKIRGVSNSFIGGGANNTISGSSSYATLGGGRNNKIYTLFQGQTIAGGRNNRIYANSASMNTIAGGYNTKVYGSFVFIGGGSGNKAGNSAGVSTYGAIAGGKSNIIHSGVIGAFIGSGQENIVSGSSSSIMGGIKNNVASSFNVVNGGSGNTISTSSNYSLINGGKLNNINSSTYSFISSGLNNRITNGSHHIILGGHNNVIQSAGTSHITVVNLEYITANTPSSVYIPKLFMMSANTGGTHLVTYSPNADKQVFYKSLSASTNITITDDGATITISASVSGGTGGTQTFVQNGVNTYTGGTSSAPTVNLSDNITLNSISANTISGGTLYSGSTNLGTIINNAIPSGANLWRPDGTNSIRANNGYTSAGDNFGLVWGKYNTIYNSSHYATIGGQNNVINNSKWASIPGGLNNSIRESKSGFIVGMSNTITANSPYNSNQSSILGGQNHTIYNASNSSINSGNLNYVSGQSSTNLFYSSIINGKFNKVYTSYSTVINGINSVLRSQHSAIIGANHSVDVGLTTTYGYSFTSGKNNTLYRSNFGFVVGSGHTLQTKYSAIIGGQNYSLTEANTVLVPKLKIANLPLSTNAYVLLVDSSGRVTKQAYSTGGTGTQTYIQNGLNTYTGGTSSLPTVNVSALTINTLTASGNTSLATLSATTIYSGSTNLSDLFVISGTSLGGASIFTGKTNGVLQFKGLSAGTNINLTTDLNVVQINTNVSGLTFADVNITGTTKGLSATTAYTQYLKVNTLSASTTNPERVFVYDGVNNNGHSNVFVGMASASTYAQLNIRNLHPGSNASSDVVATANNGDESINYVDMGINSSTFAGYVGGVNDAYLYTTGNHLWLGTVTTNKAIYMITDGTGTTNSRLTITSAVTTSNVPFSANTISGGTYFSGSTPLTTVIRQQITGNTVDGYTYIIKSADQDVTNAGVTNDSELLFSVVAGGRYAVSMELICAGNNTTADYTCQFSVDAGTIIGKGTQQGTTAAGAIANVLVTANAVANTTSVPVATPTASLTDLTFVSIQFAFTASNTTTFRFKFGNATPTVGATSRTVKGTVMKYKRLD